MASCEASCSNAEASSSYERMKTLCSDSMYLLCGLKKGRSDVEIVFIHGFQLGSDFEKAYVTTWLARNGVANDCWPSTWLNKEFPNARVLSISYVANLLRSPTEGKMDLYSLGEKLVQEMVLDKVMIGQQGCPVVFVCHSIGGLIAKQIMVSGQRMSHRDGRIKTLVHNVKAFFFYATPHRGSKLANLARLVPNLAIGWLDLEVFNAETARLEEEFKAVNQEVCNGKWKFYVVGETLATSFGLDSFVVVEEASARYGWRYMAVAANHFDVCKPKSDKDTSFLCLVEFIREVVNEEEGLLLDVPEFAVAVEEQMEKLRGILKGNAVVGLVGMGGIGKTTLSKFLYNRDQHLYERSCFLEDVKSRGNMRLCQKQLYRDLCGSNWDEEKNDEVNLKKIRDCMSRHKVLVVVDDVGLEENLDALQVVGVRHGSCGSKMIVTSRDELNMPDLCSIMRMDEIGEEQSMELFSYYAFYDMEWEVRMQMHEQATKIVKACGGLSLSLEVIGQHLRKLSKTHKSLEVQQAEWEGTLRKLKAAESLGGSMSNERLWKKLRISYDDLAEGERRLFLDFACILWRSPRESSIRRICDSPVELENLKMCSLVKVGKDGRLVMHKLLQDMGMKIVNEECDGGHWNGVSRLWTSEKIMSLESNGGKELWKLEGLLRDANIELVYSPTSIWKRCLEMCQGNEIVNGYPNLRLLNLEGNKSNAVEFYLQRCTKELRWLCLNEVKVTQKSMEMVGLLKGLRVFQLKGCGELEMLPRGIGNLYNLRELNLSNCWSLRSLPETIGNLNPWLQKLVLRRCKSLKALPNSICNLLHLIELNLRSCVSLECLPQAIGNLNLELQRLVLRGCASLKVLPNSICDLLLLEELNLGYCENLECLPKRIGNLKPQLQKMDLSGCTSLKTLPDSLCNLLSLEELSLGACENLQCLPKEIGNLKCLLRRLDLRGCKNLKVLPNLLCDLLLYELNLEYCASLEYLPERIGNLKPRLQKMVLRGCKSLKVLPNTICDLLLLEELDLGFCARLEYLPERIGNLKPRLQRMDLVGCTSLKTLPNSLCNLSFLKKLNLEHCENLECLPEGIGNLKPWLQILGLVSCKNLKTLPSFL